jgi:hypothetical protein
MITATQALSEMAAMTLARRGAWKSSYAANTMRQEVS